MQLRKDYTHPLHSFFNGNATRSAKAQEKLIGRVFLPLQKIALEGEDRELPLDPKKPGGASVIIHLSVKGSQVMCVCVCVGGGG